MNHGKEKKNHIVTQPTYIPIPDKCIDIQAGPAHSYAIAKDKVYFWGEKHTKSHQQEPNSHLQSESEKLVTIPIRIDNLATGPSHTFAWNSKQVYCWGSNRSYELGLQQQKDYGCERVELLQQALQRGYDLHNIACGDHHSLAVFSTKMSKKHLVINTDLIDSEQEVYQGEEDEEDQKNIQLFAWGQSQSYQLTINTVDIIPYPVLSPCTFKHLEHVYSRSDYNIALCNGKVYSWGSNLFSRLGIASDNQHLTQLSPKTRIPKRVNLLHKISKIGIGSYHVVAVAVNGQAFSWGKGNQGQLGIDRFQAQSRPTRMVCEQKIIDASCGDSHTVVLLHDSRLKSCGNNQHGNLGHFLHEPLDKKKRCKKLQFVECLEPIGKIIRLVSGAHHNIVMNTQGKIFGWGSNNSNQIFFKDQVAPNQSQSKNTKLFRKSLEIIVDNDDQHSKPVDIQQKLSGSNIDKLADWKMRYQTFKYQKNREEEAFMKQLNDIMQSLNSRV